MQPWNKWCAAFVCASAALLASCDLGSQTASPAATTLAPATESASASTPIMTQAEGTTGNLSIVDLKIYQDFMPMVPATGPPLRAALTLEINVKPGQPPANAGGKITITRPGGELIATAGLTQAQPPDDLGFRHPGPQQLVLSTQGIAIKIRLVEGETLQGSATIVLGGNSFDLKLPQTQVVFTH